MGSSSDLLGDIAGASKLPPTSSDLLRVHHLIKHRNGFQKLDKIKDPNRQSKQLEELTGKMRECKRLIKEFDREVREAESGNPPEVNKQLNEKKQSLIKELNSYVALRKTYTSSLGNKRVELFEGAGGNEAIPEDNVQMAAIFDSYFSVDNHHAVARDSQGQPRCFFLAASCPRHPLGAADFHGQYHVVSPASGGPS